MQQKSLGLIETQGLAAGIEAADAAVKSANVELVGYELTKGGGWTTIKILGDVGAVKAAVDAARIAAGKVSRVVSTRVIARPSMGLTGLIHNTDTVEISRRSRLRRPLQRIRRSRRSLRQTCSPQRRVLRGRRSLRRRRSPQRRALRRRWSLRRKPPLKRRRRRPPNGGGRSPQNAEPRRKAGRQH